MWAKPHPCVARTTARGVLRAWGQSDLDRAIGGETRRRSPRSASRMTKVHQQADSSTPAITFVVPVRNDAARLRGCLDRIRRNERGSLPIEIVVVDNGSVDGSDQLARA